MENKILEADLLHAACLYQKINNLNFFSSRFMGYLHSKKAENRILVPPKTPKGLTKTEGSCSAPHAPKLFCLPAHFFPSSFLF